METQPIYLSSDDIEITSPCSSPIRQLPNNVLDTYSAKTQVIAAQHEQMSSSSNIALQYPLTPPTSLISDNDNDEVFTPLIGTPAQLVPYTPNRRPNPLHLCQQLTPIPYTPESPTPKNHGQTDIFRPYELPEDPTTSTYSLPTVSTATEGIQDMELHARIETNAYVTGCLVCGKPYEQVIEEAAPDYLHQTAEPRETASDRILKRMAFLDGLQSGVITLVRRAMSQTAACDGQVYTVKYTSPQPGTQTNFLPLVED